MRQLVNKALAVERIIGMRYGTPEPRRYMYISDYVLVSEIRYRVWVISEYPGIDLVNTIFDELRINRNRNRLIRLLHMPTEPVAVFVERATDFYQRNRTVAALTHIFLARPLQSYWRAWNRHRNLDRLFGEILMRSSSSKATTRVHFMHMNFLQCQAGSIGCCGNRRLAILGANPHLQFIGGIQRRSILRFHGGVVHEAGVILGLEHFMRIGKNFVDIAIFSRDRCIRLRESFA